ncbi:hypothetical protein BGW80DRAFT_1296474, partial [Lactifluus volemus]
VFDCTLCFVLLRFARPYVFFVTTTTLNFSVSRAHLCVLSVPLVLHIFLPESYLRLVLL